MKHLNTKRRLQRITRKRHRLGRNVTNHGGKLSRRYAKKKRGPKPMKKRANVWHIPNAAAWWPHPTNPTNASA